MFGMTLKVTAGIYLFKVIIGNTKTMCEISSKLRIKAPVSNDDFEQVNAGWLTC